MEDYNPVGWFEIPVVDLDRAETFYETLLGIALIRQPEKDGMTMSWFPMHESGKGTSGSLVKHDMYTPSQNGAGVIIYFTTPDFDNALARVEEAGCKIIFPKKDIGEHGYIAGVEDTEGNHIALHTRK